MLIVRRRHILSIILPLLSAALLIIGNLTFIPDRAKDHGLVRAASTYTPPSSIASNCSADVTTALNNWFASLPSSNIIISLPANGCYLVSNSQSSLLLIQHMSGLTLDGNGTTLKQTNYAGGNVVTPVLSLGSNSTMTINNLIITGPGSGGGSGNEGDYGIKMWLNNDVTFNALTVQGVDGDGMAIYPSPSSQTAGVNKNVTIKNSTFQNIGYHTLTPESVDGLMVENNNFPSADFDAEVDWSCQGTKPPYPTSGNPCGTPSAPTVGAENVTITSNTFPNGAFIEMSISCMPAGNWTITNNNMGSGTLDFGLPLGYSSSAYTTCGPYQNLTIKNNQGTATTGKPLWGSGSEFWDIYGWNNVDISNNDLTFPAVQVGDIVMKLCADTNTTIANNKLIGLNTFTSTNCGSLPANGTLTVCQNTYGPASKEQTDSACPTPPPTSSPTSPPSTSSTSSTTGQSSSKATDGSSAGETKTGPKTGTSGSASSGARGAQTEPNPQSSQPSESGSTLISSPKSSESFITVTFKALRSYAKTVPGKLTFGGLAVLLMIGTGFASLMIWRQRWNPFAMWDKVLHKPNTVSYGGATAAHGLTSSLNTTATVTPEPDRLSVSISNIPSPATPPPGHVISPNQEQPVGQSSDGQQSRQRKSI